MIRTVFSQGVLSEPVRLYQWDFGQTLQIEGLELPAEFEMHFSNGSGAAVVSPGTAVEGIGTVAIPDECLQRSMDSFEGWVFLADENSGRTKATVKFKIERRERPSDIPPVESVTEIKGYADYVAENAEKVAEAEAAATAANAAAQAANAAAQRIDTVFENYYTKSQVESLISAAIADVSDLIGGAS